MGGTLPPDRFQKFFVQGIFLSIHTSCGNFIKIATFLWVVSIQVKNIGLWGVPHPPHPISKIFCPGSTLVYTHILCEFHKDRCTFIGRCHISQKYRSHLIWRICNNSLFLVKPHILVIVSSKSVKNYSSYRGDNFGIQPDTAYSLQRVQLSIEPPLPPIID